MPAALARSFWRSRRNTVQLTTDLRHHRPSCHLAALKNSGFAREFGGQGIQEFVNKKLIRVASIDAVA